MCSARLLGTPHQRFRQVCPVSQRSRLQDEGGNEACDPGRRSWRRCGLLWQFPGETPESHSRAPSESRISDANVTPDRPLWKGRSAAAAGAHRRSKDRHWKNEQTCPLGMAATDCGSFANRAHFGGSLVTFAPQVAFIAGVADSNGYGWAIAKALAQAGAKIIVGTWPPVLKIFEMSLEAGKFDEGSWRPQIHEESLWAREGKVGWL
eukprot:scaffold1740_cov254-Pinguiococcus_pyrenoidosus.AAC.11